MQIDIDPANRPEVFREQRPTTDAEKIKIYEEVLLQHGLKVSRCDKSRTGEKNGHWYFLKRADEPIQDETLNPWIKEIFQNFPEYCDGSPYFCKKYDYDNFHFQFIDTEQNKPYVVGGPASMFTNRQLNEALEKFRKRLREKTWFGEQLTLEQIHDLGYWDSPMLQTLLDYIFYGEETYC